MKFYALMLILFLSSLSQLAQAWTVEAIYRARGHSLGEKALQFWTGLDYFKTQDSWDPDGNKINYDGGESYSKWEVPLGARYGLSSDVEIYGHLNFRSNSSTQLESTTGTYHSKTRQGFESWNLGAQYMFDPTSSWYVSLFLEYKGRLYTNARYDTTNPYDHIILGDAENMLAGGIRFANKLSHRTLWANELSLRLPSEKLSQELGWYSELAFVTENIGWVVGVKGVESLKTSDYTDVPLTRPAKGTGATALWNSVNRTWTTPYAGVNVGFSESWRAEARVGQVWRGISTDQGMWAGLNLVYTNYGVDEREVVVSQFKEYEVEGNITRVSPRERFVLADRGLAEDIYKGQKVDVYEGDYLGGNVLIASGAVFEVRANTCVIKVLRKYRDKYVTEGMVARFK